MSKDGRIRTVRVFISSPSDVASEREAVDRVALRLNEAFADLVRIETVRWEEQFFSSHSTFQDQIPPAADCDLVVAIFWSRLGTPLPDHFGRMESGERYPSGSAYEVLTAIDARRKGDRPDVYVFRKTAPPTDFSDDAKAQWLDLNGFFSRWFQAPDGQFLCAFHRFPSVDAFERLVDELLRDWIAEHVPRDRSLIWPIETNGSPFRALLPFDAKHSKIYFGRDRKVTRAIEQLQSVARPQSSVRSAPDNVPFLLIVGESGAGKSSLMRAGLAPRLTAPGVVPSVDLWRMAVVRIGDDPNPFLTLARALLVEHDEQGGFGAALPELQDSELQDSGGISGDAEPFARMLEAGAMAGTRDAMPATGLIGAVLDRVQAEEARRRGTEQAVAANLLLLVDQLENIFAQTVTDAQRSAFARLLFAMCASRRVWVVATLRSDMYPRLITPGDFLALKDAGGVYDLAAPGEPELVEILQKSAAAAGLVYEKDAGGKGLDDTILQDAKGKNTLPLLQFALERLFEKRHEVGDEIRLTIDAYETMGGLGGAIDQTAEAALAQLGPEEHAVLPRLLRSLAVPVGDSSGGTADMTARIVPEAKVVTDEATARLVKALIDARIIVATADEGAERAPLIGLAHQRVFESWKRACDIVTDHRDFFRIRHEVESQHQRWIDRGRPRELLLAKGVPLAEAQQIVRGHADELPADVCAYVKKSSLKAQLFNIARTALTVVFGVLALVAFNLKLTADKNREEAEHNFGVARETAGNMIEGTAQGLRNYQGIGVTIITTVLETIDKAVDKLKESYPTNPLIDLGRASLRFEFAKTYQATGHREQALDKAKESYEIRSKITGYDLRDKTPALFEAAKGDWRWELSNSIELIGDLKREEAREQSIRLAKTKLYEEARAHFNETLAIRRRLAETNPDRDEWLIGPSFSYVRLGDLSMEEGNPAAANEQYRLSIINAATVFRRNQESKVLRRELSWNFNKIGDVKLREAERSQSRGGSFQALADDSLIDFKHSLCIRRDLANAVTNNTLLKRDVSFTLVRIGDARVLLGRRIGAEDSHLEAFKLRLELRDSDTKDARYGDDVAVSAQRLGAFYERDDLEKALAFYEYAADMRATLVELAPRRDEAQRRLDDLLKIIEAIKAKMDPDSLANRPKLWWRVRVNAIVDEFSRTHQPDPEAANCWSEMMEAVDKILAQGNVATR